MEDWKEVPLDSPLFQNLDESVLRKSPIILENLFINEAKGLTRAPGIRFQKRLTGGGPVYFDDWEGDLIAATGNGRVFKIRPDTLEDQEVTGVPIAGPGRITFGKTDDQLMMAAGKPIVQLHKSKTELLSETAPLSTHAVYLGGSAIAIEADSQRLFYTPPGDFTTFNPIDFLSAESQPDNLTAALVTEFSELIVAGEKSVEQFEQYQGGNKPYFRRWTVGEGIIAPYTLTSGDGEVWAVNSKQEFTSFAGQNNRPQSEAISLVLEQVTDWEGAWASKPMHLFGQKFIILQIPKATNEYGSKGITLLFDYKNKRWCYLYGWDEKQSLPAAWPGNSYHFFRGRHFVGGLDGEIYTFDRSYYQVGGQPQQARWRSAHFDDLGEIEIDRVRFRLDRGSPDTGYSQNPDFQMRVRRDRRYWGKWQTKKLGASGDSDMYAYFGSQGTALTWQFEIRCGANCPLNVTKMEIIGERVG